MKRLSIHSEQMPVLLPGDKMGCFSHVASAPNRFLFQRRAAHGSADIQHRAILHSALKVQIFGRDIRLQAFTENGESLRRWLCEQLPASLSWRMRDQVLVASWPECTPPLDEEQRLTHAGVMDVVRTLMYGVDCGRPWHCGVMFSYDLADQMEHLPAAMGERHVADVEMLCPEILLEWDGRSAEATLTGFAFAENQRLKVEQRLARFVPEIKREQGLGGDSSISTDCEDAEFMERVKGIKHYLHSGDVFQLVLSRSFFIDCPRPWSAYQQLLQQNPAPYHFYWNHPDWQLFGASPETSVKVDAHSRRVTLYPIAGTRPRGLTETGLLNADLDERLEAELRMDAKELAEHSMLVDLARNDLARICLPGARHVQRLMQVEKYSRVMHLVSTVCGHLRPELDALHAYQACLNMGTLVGAPKVRAMSLLREHEADYRGCYGGALGMIDQYGNLDTCIVIRSAFVKQGRARVQAGAGIVLDSDPHAEMEETRMKAMAVLQAITRSNQSSAREMYAYSAIG